MYRAFADIIGMTLVPECQLAREMEMCYCSLAMITDYDVWADHPVDTATILQDHGRERGQDPDPDRGGVAKDTGGTKEVPMPGLIEGGRGLITP